MQFERQNGAWVETGSIVLYGLCDQCRQIENPTTSGNGVR
jgi:hypothetical protein